VKQYGAYQARNPQTGEPVAVAPKRLPAFKPAKHLREALAAQVGEGVLPSDDGDGDGEE
jgi:nucleoid DNA-binding protein